MRSTCGIAHLRAARPGLVAVYAAVLALAWLPAVAHAQSAPATAPATRPGFENPVGWKWLLEPFEILPNAPAPHWEGQVGYVEYSFKRVAHGIVVVYLATPDRIGGRGQGNEYRVVVLADGHRHNVEPKSFMHSTEGMRYHFRPARVMPPDRPSWIGIEMLTPEGRRRQSEDALRRAAAAGVEVLPLPEIGQPLHFRLKTLDGSVVSDAELRSKVVLIDCWASTCSSCMEKTPRLRELYSARQPEGLAIIGINFDESPEKARQLIAERELQWPQVYVPSDDRTRQLWYEASSVSNLPRLILLDREGVVRGDVDHQRLDVEINKLLGGAKP